MPIRSPPARRPPPHALLALLLACRGAAQSVVRVDASTRHLDTMSHAWVVVDTQLYATTAGSNFTCGSIGSLSLDAAGASLVRQFGCPSVLLEQAAAMGGAYGSALGAVLSGLGGRRLAPTPGPMLSRCEPRKATESESFFVLTGRSYAVCGLSLWNEFFGPEGAVNFELSRSGAELVSYRSAEAPAAQVCARRRARCRPQHRLAAALNTASRPPVAPSRSPSPQPCVALPRSPTA